MRAATLRVGLPRKALASGSYDVGRAISVDMPRWGAAALDRVEARITRSEVVEKDSTADYVLVELALEEVE